MLRCSHTLIACFTSHLMYVLDVLVTDVHTAVLVLDTNVLLDHFDTLLQHLLRLRAALSRALLRVVVYVPYIVLSELDRQKNDVRLLLLLLVVVVLV